MAHCRWSRSTACRCSPRRPRHLLDAVERADVALNGDVVSRLQRAFHAVVEHCEALAGRRAGSAAPPVSVLSRPARGAAGGADPPGRSVLPRPRGSPAGAASGLRRSRCGGTGAGARARFERGLLSLMREPGTSGGSRRMCEAVDLVCGSSARERQPRVLVGDAGLLRGAGRGTHPGRRRGQAPARALQPAVAQDVAGARAGLRAPGQGHAVRAGVAHRPDAQGAGGAGGVRAERRDPRRLRGSRATVASTNGCCARRAKACRGHGWLSTR